MALWRRPPRRGGDFWCCGQSPLSNRQPFRDGNEGRRLSTSVMGVVETLVNLARRMRFLPPAWAVSWALRRREISTVLAGVSRSGQLKELIQAVDIDIAPSVFTTLDALNEGERILPSAAQI
jgi:aryl-alcohol dehydrogenase-like predicted oxidoreductase